MTIVEYLGKRPESLSAYKLKGFVKGPYDFSKGPCKMADADAVLLLTRNPRGFRKVVTQTANPTTPSPPS